MDCALTIDPAIEYERIASFYDALGEILKWPESRLLGNTREISRWNVGQHIVHISMAHSGMWRSIGRILSECEPALPAAIIQPEAIAILRSESFERYTAQAPPVVQPEPDVTIEEIRSWSNTSRKGFLRMADIAPFLEERSYFLPHPILGPLDARAWLRTLRIHGNHHLDIIGDIDAARS